MESSQVKVNMGYTNTIIKGKSGPANRRSILSIVETIKRIKTSSIAEEKIYMEKARQDFDLDPEEKWVLTKLRLLLLNQSPDFSLLQITDPNMWGVTKLTHQPEVKGQEISFAKLLKKLKIKIDIERNEKIIGEENRVQSKTILKRKTLPKEVCILIGICM